MKITAISDTHKRHEYLELPQADCIVCCGDFSENEKSFYDFVNFYGSLDYKYKILVAGNHDIFVSKSNPQDIKNYCKKFGITYLQNESVEIEGVKFWGSPYSNEFFGWPFMADEPELEKIWSQIPDDTNIVITHGPAYGNLDRVKNPHSYEQNVGSKSLLNRLNELSKNDLVYHFCGHIHEGAGIKEGEWITYNAAFLDERYKVKNQPVVFIYNDSSI